MDSKLTSDTWIVNSQVTLG